MKKQKPKPKGTLKEANTNATRGQVVKLRPAKPKTSWLTKLPSPGRWFATVRDFVVEAWQELKKVTFPTRKETLGTTAVGLFLVFVISIFLGFVDLGLSRLVSFVMR
jgi:preprotein translocase subunit SecE